MNQKIIQQPISRAYTVRLLFLVLATVSFRSYSYGQTSNIINPIDTETLFKNQMMSTPSTAALKQNIVYPVNYCTGLPEIKIPLYEVHSGNITLPIYLTYHASGIKLNETAGWAGLGWDLVAEPMITRTIQGSTDDWQKMTCTFDKNAAQKQFPFYVKNLTKTSREEPDEYYYRLPDKQGMFMYAMEPVDKSRKYLPVPYENIRIDWTGDYFRITNDDGTVYKFDGGTEREAAESSVIGWKASSIVASNMKDSISFVYNESQTQYRVKIHDDYIIVRDGFSGKKGIYTNREADITMTDYMPDECMQDPVIISRMQDVTYGYQCDDDGNIVSDGTVPDRSVSGHYMDTRSQQLNEIHFSQGKVVFTKDNKFPRVQTMTVYDHYGQFVKEIRFNYYTPNDRVIQRYFLKSVVTVNKEGKAEETYRFGYENPNRLPEPGNRSIDYWGYFNGLYRQDNVTLVPGQTIETSRWKYSHYSGTSTGFIPAPNIQMTFGSPLSREADEIYMKYGVLDSITYPTGSTDKFVYEAHRYRDTNDSIKQAGGLRIKQIITKDTNSQETKVRTFTYGSKEDGCGTPFTTNILDYFQLEQGLFLCEVFDGVWKNEEFHYCPIPNEYCSARQCTFYCNPIRPITFDGGSSVMYDYVTEYNGIPEKNSGKTVYNYAIDETHPSPEKTNAMQCNPHNGWMYGHLVKKTIYRKDNKQCTPLEETEYDYSIYDKNFGKILTGEAAANYVVRESSLNAIPQDIELEYSYQRTEVSAGSKLLKRSTRKVLTGDTPISRCTEYKYTNPVTIYPTDITETGSDNVQHTTHLTYPQDYGSTFPYADMVHRNIANPIVKKEYARNGEYICIETPYTQSSDNVYLPDRLVIKQDSSDTGDTRATYLYDDYGRLRQETRDGKQSIVYLYGYRNQYVVARIENATYEEVETKAGRNNLEKMASEEILQTHYKNLLDNLRHTLPASCITTYTYKPLTGIDSITDAFGLTTYFDYDDLGRLTKTYFINSNKIEVVESHDYHYAE